MNWKLFWKSLGKTLVIHKEGIIVGAIVGLLAAFFFASQPVDIQSIVGDGSGLMDSVMSRSSPVDVATYKFYVGFMLLGALIGYLGDVLFLYTGVGAKKKKVSQKRSRRRRKR